MHNAVMTDPARPVGVLNRRHITTREAWEMLGIPASTMRVWLKREKLFVVSVASNGENWFCLSDVLKLREQRAEWLVKHGMPDRV